MPRSPLLGAAFTMAGQVSARLIALVFYAVLARALGPQLYGDQGFGVAVGTLFVSLVEPGLNQLLVRDGARSREVLLARLSEHLAFKLWMLLLAWPLAVGAALALGYRGTALTAVLLAGGFVLVGALEDLAAAVLTAVERLDLEGLLRTLSKVCVAGLGLTAILAEGSFAWVLGAMCVGAAVAGGVGLALVVRAGVEVRLHASPLPALRQVRAEWPVALSVVLWLLTLRMDQLVVSLLGVGHDQLGHYNAAVKIVEALLLFPNAVCLAFQPVIARSWTRGTQACTEDLRRAVLASLCITLPVAVGGAVVAEPLTALVYGERFAGTAVLLRVQLMALPLVGLQFLGNHTLVAAGAVRLQATCIGVNLLVNVAFNLLLVPRYGVVGSSAAALAGGLAAVVAFSVALRSVGLRAGILGGGWRPLLGCLAMVGVLEGVPLPFAAQVVVGGVTYGAVLLAVGGGVAWRALRDARR
jgi:O-antigen/teichoic acid export membrane protein